MASLPLISKFSLCSNNISNKTHHYSLPRRNVLHINNHHYQNHMPKLFNEILSLRGCEYWRIRGIDDGSCGIPPYEPPKPPSVSEIVSKFYEAINARDHNMLDQLLSDNCHYEDLIFYVPFQGKEGVKCFLNNMMEAMGPNVVIIIDSVSEGEDFTATTFCHLQWNYHPIPYTSASRHFKCEEIDGKLMISKIISVEELPIKAGDIVLKLLKAATTFFDLRPTFAEGLLRVFHDKA